MIIDRTKKLGFYIVGGEDMKRSLCNITRIMGIACAISAIFYIRKCMSGKALFVSSGIKVEYPLINLENSQVTALFYI